MTSSPLIVARLNERTQPLDRGALYEDPLDALLKEKEIGQVSGGGSQLASNGEIEYCEIDITLAAGDENSFSFITQALETLGAPKGSKLIVEPGVDERAFGRNEGLAIYLNGTDLPDSVYSECDANFVYSEFNRLLESIGSVHSHWQGPTETALYVYGTAASSMQAALEPFLNTYPLCQKCRVVQIA